MGEQGENGIGLILSPPEMEGPGDWPSVIRMRHCFCLIIMT
jgi:hypothetical protein